MKDPKKKPKCLIDLLDDEIQLANEMVEDGFWDYEDDEEGNSDIDREWTRALKDIEELGFTDEIN